MEAKRSPSVIMVIHDERLLPDIHAEGLLLNPGFAYTISVSKVTNDSFSLHISK